MVSRTLEAPDAQVSRGTVMVPVIVVALADVVLEVAGGTLAAEARGGDLLAVMDEADRIHLPRAVAARFPDRRLRLTVDGDAVRMEEP